MAVSNKIRITRDKLAEFVPDHDTIRQLEILITLVNALEDPEVVTITDATDIVTVFPLASERKGRKIYRRTGAGAGTLTINTQNVGGIPEELILLDGSSVSTIVLSGEETLEVYLYEGKHWVLIN